ncbi:MFS transporter [Roseomonas sp. NAR14]|uniref:MFS transporter n=1 Tax=Roseomonas acroporae TaxID=2937791 RepID=A0A9X1YJM0_9PROT|nr:MFS transporter [Roseomonas acroporae]MCK8787381.1 MFS transporter [Roseomonas acroporae]
MSGTAAADTPALAEARESWTPMICIALAQVLMSFNVAALPVSLSGMVASFGVPPTTVATGIVMYSLAVAGFVMLGAKLVQRFGATRVFRAVIGLFAVAQVLMVISPVATVMLAAQLLAGLAAAVIVPALVALIANHYRGQQQATAVGALGSARAGAGVAAFLIGGLLGTFIGWRPVFGILVVLAFLVFFLTFRLKPDPGRPEVRIDLVGVVLAAASIILIVFGFNNLNRWGLGVARPGAPFSLLGLSPAPAMIVVGIVLLQCFILWSRRQAAAGRTPLLDLRVITSGEERAAVYAMFTVVALEAMLNFTVPLYIQIVQGRTPIETAIAMLPFNLTVFFTAMLVVRLYKTVTPRRIAQGGFALCIVGLLWLAWVVRNDWTAVAVMLGLIVFGIGQGALVTLVFNVLVTAAPKELAGDVGSLRGTTQNLAAGVGTAVAGALLVGLLSAGILYRLNENPLLPANIQAEVDLDSLNFVSNDRLGDIMARTSADPAQVAEAVRINAEARLQALKIGLLLMAGVALLALIPASRLPAYRPGEIPPDRGAGVGAAGKGA